MHRLYVVSMLYLFQCNFSQRQQCNQLWPLYYTSPVMGISLRTVTFSHGAKNQFGGFFLQNQIFAKGGPHTLHFSGTGIAEKEHGPGRCEGLFHLPLGQLMPMAALGPPGLMAASTTVGPSKAKGAQPVPSTKRSHLLASQVDTSCGRFGA